MNVYILVIIVVIAYLLLNKNEQFSVVKPSVIIKQGTVAKIPPPPPKALTTTPSPYTYSGNDGSMLGSAFCMRQTNGSGSCIGGFANDKKISLSCTDNQGSSNSSWNCSGKTLFPYAGNNGSINGAGYCQGIWGSSNGQNKNMNCIGGWAVDKKIPLSCTDNQGSTNSSWNCSGTIPTTTLPPTTSPPITSTSTTPLPTMPSYQNLIDGCETGANKVVSCPSGIISDGSIKYGRWNNSVCPGTGVTSTTVSKYTVSKLPSTCLGQGSCTLANLNTVVGDSYPNVTKQYNIGYSCSGRTYNAYPQADFTGQGDISSQTGTIDSCKIACDKLSNCNGFTYAGSNCYFKNINNSNTLNLNPSSTYYYTSGGEGTNPYASYIYHGNNGTVNGDTYCAGAWESPSGPSGQNKNMKCIGGINYSSGTNVACNTVVGVGNTLAYKCG